MSFNIQLAYRLERQLLQIGAVIMALFIVVIYFSTSLAIILSGVLGLIWLGTAQFRLLPAILKHHRVTAWVLLLFGCFLVGLSYGSTAASDAISMVKKYRELAFLPVLLVFLATPRYRDWAWTAFIVASVITLLASFLIDFDVFGLGKLGDSIAPSVKTPSIKSRITHGIFMAFFSFYCLHKFYEKPGYRSLFLIGFLLCLYNLFFMVEGRTGQLLALALIMLFAIQRLAFKERLLAVLAIAVCLGLFLGFSDKASRINEGFANTQAYLQEQPDQSKSSMGQRFTFWKYSLKLIAEKPWFGHGTGSFAGEYQRVAAGEKTVMTQNPHNEFMMIGVQLGLFGLIPYLGFLATLIYYSQKLSDQDKWLAEGLVMSLLITSLFNTPFFDHTEGHWFAAMIALCFAAPARSEKTAPADA
jgi:O-antigen ligase